MHKQRFGHWLVLACMGAVAACTSQGDEGAAGNTNIKLVVNEGNISDTFFTARYQIVCDGADTGPADTPDGIAIDDQRAFEGNFEVTGEVGDATNIFEVLMDLPLGECTLRIFVEDEDEVICTGQQAITIVPGDQNLFQIRLVCDVSLQTPVGSSVVLADFEEVTGNFCPFVNIANTLNRTPALGTFDVDVEFRAMDIGNTCGGGCDCTSSEAVVPGACSTTPPTELDLGLAAQACALPQFVFATTPPEQLPLVILDACGDDTLGNAVGSFNPAPPYFAGGAPSSPPNADGQGVLNTNTVYTCDAASPGPTVICFVATDGDTECGKIKCDIRDASNPVSVICPGTNFCDEPPIPDCSAPSDCESAGTGSQLGCDPSCDPALGTCEQCPDQGTPTNEGGDCTVNGGAGSTTGNVCDATGACVECLLSQNVSRCYTATGPGDVCTANAECASGICSPTNDDCDTTPIDCLVPSRCSGGNTCTGRTQAPVGAPCSNGVCDSNGDCQFQAVDQEDTKVIQVACTNGATTTISILDFELSAGPAQFLSGAAVSLPLDGKAAFTRAFLDVGLGLFGDLQEAEVQTLQVTVQAKAGLTGPDPVFGIDTAELTRHCTNPDFPDPCTILCDNIADCTAADECPGAAFGNTCADFGVVPTTLSCDSTGGRGGDGTCDGACDAGGFCETSTPLDAVTCAPVGVAQCVTTAGASPGSYCILGDAEFGLAEITSDFTVGASGDVLLGWYDDDGNCPLNTDGTYVGAAGATPPFCLVPLTPVVTPTPPIGLTVVAGPAPVSIDCIMAINSGEATCSSGDRAGLPCSIAAPELQDGTGCGAAGTNTDCPPLDVNNVCVPTGRGVSACVGGAAAGVSCTVAGDCPGGACQAVPDKASPTPTEALIQFTIQQP